MGRPCKIGLDYFPLNTNFMSDLNMQRLVMMHGGKAVSVYLVLVSEIYAKNGYFIPQSNDLFVAIGFTLHLHETEVKEVVDWCVKIGLFDAKLLKKWGIYTSFGIQRRFYMVSKRVKLQIDKRYLTARMAEFMEAEKEVSATISDASEAETPASCAETVTNKNKNKNKNQNKNKNKNQNQQFNQINNYAEYEKEIPTPGKSSRDSGANNRLAELRRMRDAATSKQDV